MPIFLQGAAVAALFVLLAAPPVVQSWLGADTGPYVAATMVFAGIGLLLGLRRADLSRPRPSSAPAQPYVRVIILTAAIVLVIFAAHSWINQILTVPHDPLHADMLIVVQEAVKRALAWQNPYTVYHVPWPAPLAYGPLLWGPYAIPMQLRADVRFLSVAGELFVPVACAIAAVAYAWRGRPAAAAACIAMLAAMAFSPDLRQFAAIGHTPVYWPLLVLFAWLVVAERWPAAALVLGLLVAARSTMAAIVPALLITIWLRERRAFVRALLWVVAGAALPFLPFALWDLKALMYGLYGGYQETIKTFVWTATTWTQHSIGVTGVLLSAHLQRWVEAVQIVLMIATYAGIWIAIKRGRSPIGLIAVALLAFTMTILWPTSYFYFDVLILFAAAILAAALPAKAVIPVWSASAVAAILVVLATAAVMLPRSLPVSVGVTWRDDPHVATALLVRRTTASALIDVQTGPAPAAAPPVLAMTATLNGTAIGTFGMSSDHGLVTLAVPSSFWQIGVNKLDLAIPSPVEIALVTARPPP